VHSTIECGSGSIGAEQTTTLEYVVEHVYLEHYIGDLYVKNTSKTEKDIVLITLRLASYLYLFNEVYLTTIFLIQLVLVSRVFCIVGSAH
jgi:hypothetical protein